MNRRKFISISSLASGALLVPNFLKAFENKKMLPGYKGKKLVVLQLSGGNDGLNTIIPFGDDNYYKLRPKLSIAKNDLVTLSSNAGLNNAFAGLESLFKNGELCIINTVGYPNADFSHFRSMDIWQSAGGGNQLFSTGWIGRYLDANCEGNCKPHFAIELDDTLSLALKGEKINGFAARNPDKMPALTHQLLLKDALAKNDYDQHDNAAYLYKTLRETFSSTAYIGSQSKIYKSNVTYPDNGFSNDLKNIAELIIADTETSVYYASIAGFDTHVNQKMLQEKYLKIVGDGIQSFTTDLKNNNKFDDVLILIFSEFGRRVVQNASGGTDHGSANNVYLISGALKKKGFYNAMPDLATLDGGNLKYTIDFRKIYATILDKWLGADSNKILGSVFTGMDFV